MNKLIVLLGVCLLASCQSKQQQPEVKTAPALEEAANKPQTNVQYALASDKDFICGMTVTAGECDTAMYMDKIYGFCAEDCKKEFLANPSKYVK